MPESFAPKREVSHARNVEDAMLMLDSRTPLTHQERKLVAQSLYDLAFREGARQGRQAGVEHVQNVIREKIAMLSPANEMHNYAITVLQGFLPQPTDPLVEYPDTTTTIRHQLEEKQRSIRKMTQQP